LSWVGSVSRWVGLGRITQNGPMDNSDHPDSWQMKSYIYPRHCRQSRKSRISSAVRRKKANCMHMHALSVTPHSTITLAIDRRKAFVALACSLRQVASKQRSVLGYVMHASKIPGSVHRNSVRREWHLYVTIALCWQPVTVSLDGDLATAGCSH